MKKEIFNKVLYSKLSLLPEQEKNRILEFYSEYIADRIENGEYEENIIADLGSIDGIAEKIIQDYTKEKIVTPKFEDVTKKEEKMNFDDVLNTSDVEIKFQEQIKKEDYNPNLAFKKNNANITSNTQKELTKKSNKKSFSLAKWILIVFGSIILLPVIIGLLAGLFGILVGLLAGYLSIFVCCFALSLSAIAIFIGSFFIMAEYTNSALLQMAFAMIIFGISIVACRIMTSVTKLLIKCIKKLVKVLVKKNA